jgi:hypothetical protein
LDPAAGDDESDNDDDDDDSGGRNEPNGDDDEQRNDLRVPRSPVGGDGKKPSSSIIARVVSSDDGGPENFDTLSPLTGDIEMGQVRQRKKDHHETTTASAPESQRTGGVVVNRRRSSTGTTGTGTRERYARVRSSSSGVPLPREARRNRALAKFFQLPAPGREDEDGSGPLTSPEQGTVSDRRKSLALMHGGGSASASAGGNDGGGGGNTASNSGGGSGGGDDELRKTSMHGRIMVSTRNWDTPVSSHSSSHHLSIGGGGRGGSQHLSAREGRVYEPEIGESLVRSEGLQYRLEAVSVRELAMNNNPFWYNLLTCFGYGRSYNIYDDPITARDAMSGWSANALVIRYLYWTFRSNIMAVFMSAAFAYFFAVTLFALGIWSIAIRNPTCVGGLEGGVKPDATGFLDCWHLSFTTFSTVVRRLSFSRCSSKCSIPPCISPWSVILLIQGYGVVYAGTFETHDDVGRCTGMAILTSLEAFYGNLFFSLCCAILFARVGRAQSYAQVTFSDPIVIRFGLGVGMDGEERESDEENDSSHAGSSGKEERIECPVLEFRLVNRMFAVTGGEIMDAAIHTIATIDANQAIPAIQRAKGVRRRGKKGNAVGWKKERRTNWFHGELAGGVPPLPEDMPLESMNSVGLPHSTDEGPAHDPGDIRNVTHVVDEDPTGNLCPRRIFSKLYVDPPDHPFFKRAWVVSHTLDQESPLLEPHARTMVCNNGGYWPSELNSYDAVRAAVSFEQIIVTMTGTSNADANTVYAQKVYDFADVVVGYKFANMLYRDPRDGSLQVDVRLLNDVTEQAGGGGEPLDAMQVGSKRNVMMF